MSGLIDNARLALRSARVLRDLGDTKGALNRAYYAAFDAVRAALSAIPNVDVQSIKSHRGLNQQFNLHFARQSRLPRDVVEEFSLLMELRGLADYEVAQPLPSEADAGIAAASKLIAAIEGYLNADRDRGS